MLSFIPPDGHFDLLRYEAVPVHGKTATASQSKTYPLPLIFKPELKLEDSGGKSRWYAHQPAHLLTSAYLLGKFSLSLTSRVTTRPIENIVISLYLGDNVHHVSATPSGDSRGIGNGNAGAVLGCVGGGTWEFDPKRKVGGVGAISGQKLMVGDCFA